MDDNFIVKNKKVYDGYKYDPQTNFVNKSPISSSTKLFLVA